MFVIDRISVRPIELITEISILTGFVCYHGKGNK